MTSPDPEYNADAREYFTRHMRVLEQVHSWSMPETQEQIAQLRTAFSEDITQPFQLRSSFSIGSPGESTRSSVTPPSEGAIQRVQNQTAQSQYSVSQRQDASPSSFVPTNSSSGTTSKQITPPPFVSDVAPYAQLNQQVPYHHQPTQLDMANWNPTPIINQFNVAFSIPQSALAPPPPPQMQTYPTMSFPRQGSFSFETSHYAQQPSYHNVAYPSQNYLPRIKLHK